MLLALYKLEKNDLYIVPVKLLKIVIELCGEKLLWVISLYNNLFPSALSTIRHWQS
jgi:hypothetical protein